MECNRKLWIIAVIVTIFVSILLVPELNSPVQAGGKHSEISVKEDGRHVYHWSNKWRNWLSTPKVFGKTIGQWSAEWWQWVLSIPAESNPLTEGVCEQNQRGPVWYLAGNFGGDSNRECRVPRGKFIFFPLVNGVFPNFPGEDFSVEEKRAELDYSLSLACNLSATLDGTPIAIHYPIIRIQSPTFPIEFIEDNIFGVDPGWVDKETVADGFWIMLPPLSKGKHVIRFTGGICYEENPFDLDVTYHITVSSGKHYH